MKEKIIKESMQLFFRYGLKSITMDDIAKELGISKKTLYQHFENKNELLLACMEEHDCKEKQILKSYQESSANAIDEMLQIANHVEKMLKMVSPSLIYDVQKYYKDAWVKMKKIHSKDIYLEIKANIERGIQEGLYRNDFDIDIISKIYVQSSKLGFNPEFFPTPDYDINLIFKQNIEYHLHGIVSPKGLAVLKQMSLN